jgi:hypothetical protein
MGDLPPPVGLLVARVHGDPQVDLPHEMRQIQLDAYVSNGGEPVKSDPGTAYVRGCRRSDCREYRGVRMAANRH